MSETTFKIGDQVVHESQVMTVFGTDGDVLTCVWQGPKGTRRMQFPSSMLKLFVPPKRR